MLQTIQRIDKVAAAEAIFTQKGMMEGSTLSYSARMLDGEVPSPPPHLISVEEDDDEPDVCEPDVMTSVSLARTPG